MADIHIYISSPCRLININNQIKNILASKGNIVHLPSEFCKKEDEDENQKNIREKCIDAIDKSDIFLLFINDYGMDSAWELGYAERSKKVIIGFRLDNEVVNTEKKCKPQSIMDHWMHDWKNKSIYVDFNELMKLSKNKRVFLSIHTQFELMLHDKIMQLKETCEKLYVPWELLNQEILEFPKEKSGEFRKKYKKAIEDSDIFIFFTDDYRIASAWELGYAEKGILGYAEKLEKKIVGYSLDMTQTKNPKIIQPFTKWDQWILGWNCHKIISGYNDLLSIDTIHLDIIKSEC